jgi:hypothetical protein
MDTPNPAEIEPQDQSRSLEQRVCARCGKPRPPRATRFCSQACNTAAWDEKHPRVGRGPQGPRQGSIRAALLAIMADGEWYTKAQLAELARAFEHSVGTRLSELRRQGFRVESDGVVGDTTRPHRFRLVLAPLFLACVCNFHILFGSVKEIVHRGVKFLG